MKKIIIISYFFPPANFVGAQRTANWFTFLSDYNIYPIVITRQWNNDQCDITSEVINNELNVEKYANGEIHRLPFKHSFRNSLAKNQSFRFIQKTLTFFELIFSNFYIHFLPFSNFYNYSKKIIKNDNEIKAIIASGRPFQSFFIGYRLKKDFPKLHWIPDYRDEWNSFKRTNTTISFLQKIIVFFEKKSELKWTSNASAFLTVGQKWKEEIEKHIQKKGIIIYNGYNQNDNILKDIQNLNIENQLNITYAGTLYENQPIELVIQSIIDFYTKHPNFKIQLTFVGIEPNEAPYQKVINLTKEFPLLFSIIKKQSKQNLKAIYEHSDLLLLTKYKKIEGITPVKLFDYFISGIPIVLFPSDNDIMHKFIEDTNAGYVLNNENIVNQLLELYQLKQQNKTLKKKVNEENALFYTTENQTKILAEFLISLNI